MYQPLSTVLSYSRKANSRYALFHTVQEQKPVMSKIDNIWATSVIEPAKIELTSIVVFAPKKDGTSPFLVITKSLTI